MEKENFLRKFRDEKREIKMLTASELIDIWNQAECN